MSKKTDKKNNQSAQKPFSSSRKSTIGKIGSASNGRTINKDREKKTTIGVNDGNNIKEDEIKEEEPVEEEKKFEPSNHIEAELVDILGNHKSMNS